MGLPLYYATLVGLHAALAFGLYQVVNWVGARSKTFGYVSLRPIPQTDGAPAFNVLLRVGAPVAYLLLVSAALYAVRGDPWVREIWSVVALYFAGRIALNVWLGRRLRMNWARELGQAALSTGVAWLLYDKVIRHRETLLPDAKTVAAELWVIVALFVFSLLNGVRLNPSGSEGRARRYVADVYRRYRQQYGEIVEGGLPLRGGEPDRLAESIVYAVMIHEGFNRPPRAQKVERWLQRVFPTRPRTLGPMQVRTVVPLTDDESVRLGVERVVGVYQQAVGGTSQTGGPVGSMTVFDIARAVARDYNRDDDYIADVAGIHGMVVTAFYPGL